MDHTQYTAPAVEIQIGHEYEVCGDAAVWHQGRLLRGVWLNADGAWAGCIRDENGAEFVDVMDRDGDFIPARNCWETGIVREIAGAGVAPAVTPAQAA